MFAELDLDKDGKVLLTEIDRDMDAYVKFRRKNSKKGNDQTVLIVNEYL